MAKKRETKPQMQKRLLAEVHTAQLRTREVITQRDEVTKDLRAIEKKLATAISECNQYEADRDHCVDHLTGVLEIIYTYRSLKFPRPTGTHPCGTCGNQLYQDEDETLTEEQRFIDMILDRVKVAENHPSKNRRDQDTQTPMSRSNSLANRMGMR